MRPTSAALSTPNAQTRQLATKLAQAQTIELGRKLLKNQPFAQRSGKNVIPKHFARLCRLNPNPQPLSNSHISTQSGASYCSCLRSARKIFFCSGKPQTPGWHTLMMLTLRGELEGMKGPRAHVSCTQELMPIVRRPGQEFAAHSWTCCPSSVQSLPPILRGLARTVPAQCRPGLQPAHLQESHSSRLIRNVDDPCSAPMEPANNPLGGAQGSKMHRIQATLAEALVV